MSRVTAIMPCRGRAQQTVTNVKRLLATAGDVDWQLVCVIDGDDEAHLALSGLVEREHLGGQLLLRFLPPSHGQRWGYWRCLQAITDTSDSPLIATLANDLLPGWEWLARGVRDYGDAFPDGQGLLGFNGDSHETGHSCHFLIGRALLTRYGGWPVWYDHTHGDTELCQRAISEGRYAKSGYAILFHDHPFFGGVDDATYAEGRARAAQDAALYAARKRAGWPMVPR